MTVLKVQYQHLLEITKKMTCRSRIKFGLDVSLTTSIKFRINISTTNVYDAFVRLSSFAHTMQSFNDYGEDSRLCRQVVNRYCNNIKGLDDVKISILDVLKTKPLGMLGVLVPRNM